MSHLTRSDYAQALVVLAHLESACFEPGVFILAATQALAEFARCDGATLSVCTLEADVREGTTLPGARVGQLDAIDRVSGRAVAVPLFVDGLTLVRIVLERGNAGFDAHDCERLELLRPHLAFLYREACRADRVQASGQRHGAPLESVAPITFSASLTAREHEVVHWLAAGKTDAEIGALLSISVRTVQKHLEHVYIKLGVETRTAAVMRALGNGLEPAFAIGPNL
jgi:DNA-binding CsgD family transcriptional regulator